DKDSSGIRDLGEPYLSSWTINLQRNDSIIATAQTDSLNGYLFNNLTAGTYVIKEATQTNWLQTFPANPDSYIVTVTSGSNSTGRIFGNHYVIPAVDYVKYRTFADPCSLTQKPRTLKPVKKPGQLPYIQMPTVGNVEETTFVKIFTTSSKIKKRMKIGIPLRGITNWIEIEKATAFRNFFLCNDTSRCDIAYPFDSTRDCKNKPRAWKYNILLNPTGKRYKNNLARSLATLKFNIWASDAGVTPNDSFALGDLIYKGPETLWNNLSLRQITELSRFRTTSAVIFEPGKADSALSLYRDYSFVNWSELDTVLTRINESFECPMDTIKTKPLQVKGCWGMKDLSPRYLYAPESVSVRASSNELSYSDVPDEFQLEQNYPNPFNPSTVIRYQLSVNSVVSLKVYDLLGREAAVMVNSEMMDEGEYEMEFDATNLSSGVYFYRLTANGTDDNSTSFTDVKRMLLVR
ncbi:MAG: T9SS type A sorting domain-containing protein, partial [Ignavibacteriales bacterium]|nr:T9SS type A sorting domain-containing protein [Ignavibacteriales bacterium]